MDNSEKAHEASDSKSETAENARSRKNAKIVFLDPNEIANWNEARPEFTENSTISYNESSHNGESTNPNSRGESVASAKEDDVDDDAPAPREKVKKKRGPKKKKKRPPKEHYLCDDDIGDEMGLEGELDDDEYIRRLEEAHERELAEAKKKQGHGSSLPDEEASFLSDDDELGDPFQPRTPDFDDENDKESCLSSESRNSAALMSRLLSLDEEVDLDDSEKPELILPLGSHDLYFPNCYLLQACGIYEVLRRYGRLLRLSPFRLEDFCMALISEENSTIISETHMCLLRALLREDDLHNTSLIPLDQKDSVNIAWYLMDILTWPELLRWYLNANFSDHTVPVTINDRYPFVSLRERIDILQCLTDIFLATSAIREDILKENFIRHEDYCRVCHLSGEVLCCDGCPGVFHLNCLTPPLTEVPESTWVCPVCIRQIMPGVTDCKSELEKTGLQHRHETIGRDRFGNQYWFISRRIFVEPMSYITTGEGLIYFSTRGQVDCLLSVLDVEWEADLVSALEVLRPEIERQMTITLELVRTKQTSGKIPSICSNAVLIDEHELWQKKVAERKLREEEERIRREKEVESLRMLEEASKSSNTLDEKSSEKTDNAPGEESTTDITSTVDSFVLANSGGPTLVMDKETGEMIIAKIGSISPRIKHVPPHLLSGLDKNRDPEPRLTRPAPPHRPHSPTGVFEDEDGLVVRNRDGVSVRLRLTSRTKAARDEDDRNASTMTQGDLTSGNLPPLGRSKSYRLGDEGDWRVWTNVFSREPLALNKQQHQEEKERRRYLSHKFSLTDVSDMHWLGVTNGGPSRTMHAVRLSLCNLEAQIPLAFFCPAWRRRRKEWLVSLQRCKSPDELALELLTLESCIKPICFVPVWSNSLGHLELERITASHREELKRNRMTDRKNRDRDLESVIRTRNPGMIKHTVWKTRGEEYRRLGGDGWLWVSVTRPSVRAVGNAVDRGSLQGLTRRIHKAQFRNRGLQHGIGWGVCPENLENESPEKRPPAGECRGHVLHPISKIPLYLNHKRDRFIISNETLEVEDTPTSPPANETNGEHPKPKQLEESIEEKHNDEPEVTVQDIEKEEAAIESGSTKDVKDEMKVEIQSEEKMQVDNVSSEIVSNSEKPHIDLNSTEQKSSVENVMDSGQSELKEDTKEDTLTVKTDTVKKPLLKEVSLEVINISLGVTVHRHFPDLCKHKPVSKLDSLLALRISADSEDKLGASGATEQLTTLLSQRQSLEDQKIILQTELNSLLNQRLEERQIRKLALALTGDEASVASSNLSHPRRVSAGRKKRPLSEDYYDEEEWDSLSGRDEDDFTLPQMDGAGDIFSGSDSESDIPQFDGVGDMITQAHPEDGKSNTTGLLQSAPSNQSAVAQLVVNSSAPRSTAGPASARKLMFVRPTGGTPIRQTAPNQGNTAVNSNIRYVRMVKPPNSQNPPLPIQQQPASSKPISILKSSLITTSSVSPQIQSSVLRPNRPITSNASTIIPKGFNLVSVPPGSHLNTAGINIRQVSGPMVSTPQAPGNQTFRLLSSLPNNQQSPLVKPMIPTSITSNPPATGGPTTNYQMLKDKNGAIRLVPIVASASGSSGISTTEINTMAASGGMDYKPRKPTDVPIQIQSAVQRIRPGLQPMDNSNAASHIITSVTSNAKSVNNFSYKQDDYMEEEMISEDENDEDEDEDEFDHVFENIKVGRPRGTSESSKGTTPRRTRRNGKCRKRLGEHRRADWCHACLQRKRCVRYTSDKEDLDEVEIDLEREREDFANNMNRRTKVLRQRGDVRGSDKKNQLSQYAMLNSAATGQSRRSMLKASESMIRIDERSESFPKIESLRGQIAVLEDKMGDIDNEVAILQRKLGAAGRTTKDPVSVIRCGKIQESSLDNEREKPLPPVSQFIAKKADGTKMVSLFRPHRQCLRSVIVSAGRVDFPGFEVEKKRPGQVNWIYPSARCSLAYAWRFRVASITQSCFALSLHLRLLWQSLRWDDIKEPILQGSEAVDNTRQIRKIIDMKMMDRYGLTASYLLEVTTLSGLDTPMSNSKIGRPSKQSASEISLAVGSDVEQDSDPDFTPYTPARSGLRKRARKRATGRSGGRGDVDDGCGDATEEIVTTQDWVDEKKVKLREIRHFIQKQISGNLRSTHLANTASAALHNDTPTSLVLQQQPGPALSHTGTDFRQLLSAGSRLFVTRPDPNGGTPKQVTIQIGTSSMLAGTAGVTPSSGLGQASSGSMVMVNKNGELLQNLSDRRKDPLNMIAQQQKQTERPTRQPPQRQIIQLLSRDGRPPLIMNSAKHGVGVSGPSSAHPGRSGPKQERKVKIAKMPKPRKINAGGRPPKPRPTHNVDPSTSSSSSQLRHKLMTQMEKRVKQMKKQILLKRKLLEENLWLDAKDEAFNIEQARVQEKTERREKRIEQKMLKKKKKNKKLQIRGANGGLSNQRGSAGWRSDVAESDPATPDTLGAVDDGEEAEDPLDSLISAVLASPPTVTKKTKRRASQGTNEEVPAPKRRKQSSPEKAKSPTKKAARSSSKTDDTSTVNEKDPGTAKKKRNRQSKLVDEKKVEEELFCLCKKPYDPASQYIGCDLCQDWFHFECVGMSEKEANKIKTWECPDCTKQEASANEMLYCTCRTPYDNTKVYIACDGCDEWFHASCVGMGNEEAANYSGSYLCGTCKAKTQGSRRHTKTNYDTKLKSTYKKKLVAIVESMLAHKMAWPFLKPVEPTQHVNYYKIVKEPMDLTTLGTNLQLGRYKSIGDFSFDGHRLFTNCRIYYSKGSPEFLCADVMETFFIKEMKTFKEANIK